MYLSCASNMHCKGCDTFVVLPTYTENRLVIFGKNSDRPCNEVQEVIYIPAADHGADAKLKCTYIEIDQVPHTFAVVLSKPAWMWGAEMGSNEHGVVIGNEAVFTKLNSSDDSVERLLGMDLLRLGLERSKTARESVDVISSLLEKYGQGGRCSDEMDMTYHNSFLMADRQEAWVLETAGRHWAAERVEGFRNISNNLTISTNIQLLSKDAKKTALDNGWWTEDVPFDFSAIFGKNGCDPQNFTVENMISILRNEESGICMGLGGSFVSTSSQVSILPSDSSLQCFHFFTGTPDPRSSGFKPFVFSDGCVGSPFTESPKFPDDKDPAKCIPRFKKTVDRRHTLYKAHQEIESSGSRKQKAVENLMEIEKNLLTDVMNALQSKEHITDAHLLYKEANCLFLSRLCTVMRSRVIITQLVRRKTGWGPNTYYKKGTTFVGVAPSPLKYYTIWQKKPEEPYGLQGSNHLLPEYGKVYSRLPIKVKFEKDKKYAWCSCGYSHSQPYCDGSHNRENTRLRPVRYISDKDEEVWLCNCKQTKNRPFCDGTHKSLPSIELGKQVTTSKPGIAYLDAGIFEQSDRAAMPLAKTRPPHHCLVLYELSVGTNSIRTFLYNVFKIVEVTTLTTVLLSSTLIFAVLMCFFGLRYLEKCPIRDEIPVYLVVGGSCLLLLVAMLFCSRLHLQKEADAEEQELQENNNACSRNDSAGENFRFTRLAARNTKLLLLVCYLFWFALGNYWVFSVYKPPFSQSERSPTPRRLCAQQVYLFALMQILLSYVVLGLLLLVLSLLNSLTKIRVAKRRLPSAYGPLGLIERFHALRQREGQTIQQYAQEVAELGCRACAVRQWNNVEPPTLAEAWKLAGQQGHPSGRRFPRVPTAAHGRHEAGEDRGGPAYPRLDWRDRQLCQERIRMLQLRQFGPPQTQLPPWKTTQPKIVKNHEPL
ncbi:Secernin-3 [Trichinella nativa]|uniref:Secernin-3 n=1 Tax=Trichinella nativa TaxID=6335 RepID=A0A0V1LGK2_9BILA|nr:Secernin-3 [Trichinella nativa]